MSGQLEKYITGLEKILSNKQLKTIKYYVKHSPRILFLEGAIRSGKTFVNNLMWLEYISRYRGQNKLFIMSGVTRTSIENNVLHDLNRITNNAIPANIPQNGKFEYLGNTISCYGTDTIRSAERVQGLTSQGWYGNEITKQHKDFVLEAISRCSEDGARIFWDCNPDNPIHYIYTEYLLRSGELLSTGIEMVHSIHYELDDNPVLSIEYKENLKNLFPKDTAFFKRNILGLWVASGQAIYKNYKVKDMEININDYDRLLGGADFGRGGNSESAFVLIGQKGTAYYVLAEVKAVFATNNLFVAAVQKCLDDIKLGAVKINTTIYADCSDPDKITEFANAGFHIMAVQKGAGSVLAGIEQVQRTELYVNSKCKKTIKELQSYEWETDRNGNVLDKPKKIDDHICDSTRYCIYSTRISTQTQGGGGLEFGKDTRHNFRGR